MKQRTRKQVETAKARAATAADRLSGDPDRADEFDRMSVEEYAAERGIEIVENPTPEILALINPTQKGEDHDMTKTREDLEQELSEAYEYIDELESARSIILSSVAETFGVEIFDPGDGEDEDSDFEDEEDSLEEIEIAG